MTIFKNTENGKCYKIVNEIRNTWCVCGQCGTGLFAFRIYDNDGEKLNIQWSDIGTKFLPISEE